MNDRLTELELYRIGFVGTPNKNHIPAVIMKELGGQRMISVLLGLDSPQAVMTNFTFGGKNYPSIWDLYMQLSSTCGIRMTHVRITHMDHFLYIAEMVYIDPCGQEKVMGNVKASDAIAIAIRAKVPIFISTELLEKSKLVLSQQEFEIPLQEQLDKAIESENYELAAKIRDIINAQKQ